MGFQDVRLSATALTDLYRKVLIADSSSPVTEAVASTVEFRYLGGNSRKITVIAAGKKELTESSPETQFLLKIFNACQLTFKDIALIDVRNISVPFEDFISASQPSKILIFTNSINGAAIADLCYQSKKEGNCQVLYCPDVQLMMQDNAEAVATKKKLWASLKSFFNV